MYKQDLVLYKSNWLIGYKADNKWKENFNKLLGNHFEITDKPVQKINYGLLDVKLGKFVEEDWGNYWKN